MAAEETKSKTVLPGNFLTTEEEFLAGANTYEDGEGNIYSTVIGKPSFDPKSHEVSVQKTGKNVMPLAEGCIVYARITHVRENIAFAEITSSECNGTEMKITQPFAKILVANISTQYLDRVSEVLRIGDLVKARVQEVTPFAISLTLKEPDLGVVRAYCVNCRHVLQQYGNELKCPDCGLVAKRKTASDYSLK